MGGSTPLYYADLAMIITQQSSDKVIQVIKNRNGDSDKIIKYDVGLLKSKNGINFLLIARLHPQSQ